MSEASAPVRLWYRHVPLAEPPMATEVADGVFVALSAPPPVRTVLRLEHADASIRALQVTRVVEVDGSDDRGERGFYARFVEGDALAASEKVGSEHLSAPASDPEPGRVHAESNGEDEASDAGHVAMAMPAPVVVVDEDDDDEGGSEGEDAGDESDPPADPEGDPEAEDAANSRRGRARKRRAKKPRK